MSIDKLDKKANEFIAQTKWLVEFSEIYLIDYNFPSMGVVDLLLSYFRGKYEYSSDDKSLIELVSAYLGSYICKVWRNCGLNPVVDYSEYGVLISVEGLASKAVHLNSVFRNFLTTPPKDVAVRRGNRVPLSPVGDFVCSFVHGFLRGVYFEEVEELDLVFNQDLLNQIDKEIAIQYAKWYEVVYPKESLSHLPVLYLKIQKNIHFLASNQFPLSDEVLEFDSYFKEIGLDSKLVRSKLGTIFAYSPVEYLSLLGLLLIRMEGDVLSVKESMPFFKVRSYALPLIRGSVYGQHDGKKDWIDLGAIDHSELSQIEIDQSLHFLPWLSLSLDYFKGRKITEDLKGFLSAVREGDFAGSLGELDRMLEVTPGDLELRIQRAFFYLITGEFEQGHEYCKRLLTEPGIEKESQFFYIWGSLLISLRQYELAERYLRIAFNFGDLEEFDKAEIGNSLSWCYILMSRNQEALEIMDAVVGLNSVERVSILLNRLLLLPEENKDLVLLRKIVKSCPTDRRVFANVILLGRISPAEVAIL